MKIIGYTVVNPKPPFSEYPLVCSKYARIYSDLIMAQEERDQLAEVNENPMLVVAQVIIRD